MNAAQLKLNYPEILEEIIRKVDSAVLSSKSPSILERVKCCSQSILSKKDLDLKVVAAGSLMTFLLTCAGNNILNSITEKQPAMCTISQVHLGIPDSAKLSSLVKESMPAKTEGALASVSAVNTANISFAEIKKSIESKNTSKTQSTPVSRSKLTAKSNSATEAKSAQPKSNAQRWKLRTSCPSAKG